MEKRTKDSHYPPFLHYLLRLANDPQEVENFKADRVGIAHSHDLTLEQREALYDALDKPNNTDEANRVLQLLEEESPSLTFVYPGPEIGGVCRALSLQRKPTPEA